MNIHDQNAYKQHLIGYENFEDFIFQGLNNQIVNKIVHFKLQSEFICNDLCFTQIHKTIKFIELSKHVHVILQYDRSK